MSLTPKQVFKKFNTSSLLVRIAEKQGIHLSKKQKRNVREFLAEETVKHGLNRLLSVLKNDNLIELSKHKAVSYDEERREKFGDKENEKSRKWHPVKPIMVKVLSESIANYGVTEFFGDQKRSTLLACCKIIDDLEDYDEEELQEFTKGDLSDAIMHNIYNFGLQNLFASFSITELKNFCEDCDLTVRSSSKETLLDCLIDQKDFRKVKVVKKAETKLDKKPKIKKGIKKIDLISWFLRSELEVYCRENGLKINGNKKDLVERIILFLDGNRSAKIMASSKRGRKKTEEVTSELKVKNAISGVAKRAAKKSNESKKSAPPRRSSRLEEKSRSREESSSSSSY